MTPITPNTRLFPSRRSGALRAMLSAAWHALQKPLHATWRAPAALAADRHRLGAWDFARSGLAREHLARRQPRPKIHVKRVPQHG